MSNTVNDLFKLSDAEQDLTDELDAIIRREIENNGGVIPFSRYMELALYQPSLGYYSNQLFKFGAKGDFVTAPLISSLFGHLISRQLLELFSFGVKPQVLEFGAGNGKLAADILACCGESIEHYFIIELSANLVAWQRETLLEKVPQFIDKVIWLDNLPDSFDGVMLANEVLDAQPCNLVHFGADDISGVGVSIIDGKFAYQNYTLDAETKKIATELNLPYKNYISEINLASRGFIRSLADSLNHGAVILIDYGYGEKEYYHSEKYKGTLRGFYRQHVLDSVLEYAGLIDITSSVNWTSIAEVGIDAGLELIGYTNQASFLLNCGLSSIMSELRNQLEEGEYLAISNQVNKLISHNEMGEMFKVCGFSRGLTQDSWGGFSAHDRSYSL